MTEFANETVGHRKIEGSDVWSAVQQLTETAERIRGTRAHDLSRPAEGHADRHGFLKERFLSVATVIVIGFLLLVSLVVDTVLLLWVYYSAQIVFFGAEVTRAYSREVKAQGGENGS